MPGNQLTQTHASDRTATGILEYIGTKINLNKTVHKRVVSTLQKTHSAIETPIPQSCTRESLMFNMRIRRNTHIYMQFVGKLHDVSMLNVVVH